MKTVVLIEEAADDLEAGRRFYNARGQEVGDYFLASLLSDLEALAIFGGIHPTVFGYHRMPSKRFPFAIYYEVDEELILVYAILDMRRNPLWIRHAIRKRK